MEIHLRVSAEVASLEDKPKKRLLLYKHGDDLRQELLAIQFIERCNQILLASGLDLKLKTFACQPVGSKSVSLSFVPFMIMFILMPKSSTNLSRNMNGRASLSGFEALFLYQNSVRHQDLLIQDPMLVLILAKTHEAKKGWKAKHLDILLQLLSMCRTTK